MQPNEEMQHTTARNVLLLYNYFLNTIYETTRQYILIFRPECIMYLSCKFNVHPFGLHSLRKKHHVLVNPNYHTYLSHNYDINS